MTISGVDLGDHGAWTCAISDNLSLDTNKQVVEVGVVVGGAVSLSPNVGPVRIILNTVQNSTNSNVFTSSATASYCAICSTNSIFDPLLLQLHIEAYVAPVAIDYLLLLQLNNSCSVAQNANSYLLVLRYNIFQSLPSMLKCKVTETFVSAFDTFIICIVILSYFMFGH